MTDDVNYLVYSLFISSEGANVSMLLAVWMAPAIGVFAKDQISASLVECRSCGSPLLSSSDVCGQRCAGRQPRMAFLRARAHGALLQRPYGHEPEDLLTESSHHLFPPNKVSLDTTLKEK